MANSRIVEVVYRLRDRFTGAVAKITGGYKRMGDSAERAASRTEQSFIKTGKALDLIKTGALKLGAVLATTLTLRKAKDTVAEFADQADRLGKLSEKLGYTTEDLQALGYAAARNGVEFKAMAVALQRATRRIAEVATTGKGQAAPALDALGLSAKDLQRLSLDEKMAKLADAFASVSDQGERVRLAFALFDTEGVDMVRVLQNGSVALRDLIDHAKQFGDVISNKTSKAAADLNDRTAELQKRWDALTITWKANAVGNLNEALQATGTYLSDEDRIVAQLNAAYIEREKIQGRLASNAAKADRVYRQQLEQRLTANTELIKSLQDQNVARLKLQRQRQAEAEANRQEIALNKELATAVRGLGDAYKVGADSAKAALAKETAELRAAKAEQVSIIQEFDKLVQDVAGKQKEANIIDAAYLARQAQSALDNGKMDEALKKARAAGDMLRELKDAGKGGIELKYLADQLKRVGESVGQAGVNKELIDVQAASQAVEQIKAKIAELNGTQITLDILPRITGGGPIAATLRDELTRRGSK